MSGAQQRSYGSQKGKGEQTLSSTTTSRSQDVAGRDERVRLLSSSGRVRPVSSAGYGRYPDGPPDSRQTCPSENIKFYAWEVARPTSRGQTGWSEMSRPQTGISVLTDKDMPTTGRRKKNDCIRGTDSETLVGLDVIPEPGMRVMISTRGREQKVNPPGTTARVQSRTYCRRACAVSCCGTTAPDHTRMQHLKLLASNSCCSRRARSLRSRGNGLL